MSLSSEQNLVTEILTLIRYVREREEEACDENDTQYPKDVLETIHAQLCRILAAMIVGPVHSKLYIRNPVEVTTEAQQAESISQNLRRKWKPE